MYCAVRDKIKKIYQKCGHFFALNQKGASGVLPLMFSTFGGAAFLFTFYNLTQYTSARSAADQAARRAARCLTPSDAECIDQTANGLNNSNATQNWYGYVPSLGPTTVQYDAYTYNAQAFASSYTANYSSYEVLTGNPIILHQETEVKPIRFLGLLNSYQRLRADLTIYLRKNGNANNIRACRIKEAVELPAGLDFTRSQTYFDERWCGGFASPAAIAATAPGCADVSDGTWSLSRVPSRNNSACELTIPNPRAAGEQPWLLLGGDPVCDGESEAPFSEIPQTIEALNRGFQAAYGERTVPGSKGRAFPVTGERQFVVVEVYSCNPQSFKSNLEQNIKTKDDLIKNFTSYNKIDVAGFTGNPDFDERGGVSSFVYAGASGVSFLAPQNWTYFEWSRKADGDRHLERKVCKWVTFDEAKAIYPEFSNGKTSTYVSGNQYGRDVQAIKVYDAPSCLPQTKKDVAYNCPNRTIFGQPGSLNDCFGWTEEERSTEERYKASAEQAIALNQNPSWENYENLKTDFKFEIEPRYGPNYSGEAWEFSWINSALNGKPIINPAAVAPYKGYNPKVLPESMFVQAFERTDGTLDPTLLERLKSAISQSEGQAVTADLTFEHVQAGESKAVDLSGVWPLIKEQNGTSVPTARPYINPQINGEGFDYDLNCSPDNSCANGNTYNSVEEYLRNVSSSAVSGVNLTDPAYKFSYQETLVGPQYLDVNSAQGLPACTQFRTLCANNVASGPAISLGSSQVMPASCQNGSHINCYSEYSSSSVATQKYDPVVLLDIAKNKALGEVRRLNPAANLCDDLSQANCVRVDIQNANSQVQVDVQFSAPLTTPFTEILSQNTLIVAGTKREIIETERLK